MAGQVTFRVLFGGEDDARKLIIESGIPRTVEDLAFKIKTFFQVTACVSVQRDALVFLSWGEQRPFDCRLYT